MNEDKYNMFRNRLQKVFRHFGKLARRQQVTCFRIYDFDLVEFPFRIELYEDNIYLAEYRKKLQMAGDAHAAWLQQVVAIISETTGIVPDHIYFHERQRKENREGQYVKSGATHEFFVVREQGLRFKVNLSDYLDTGLFLDHRVTRDLIRKEAAGKQVLNLFCYTGSFSVYAADGSAAGILSVDLSRTYLNWAEENFALNGFNDQPHFRFVQADVKEYLDQLSSDAFDLVVLDPPSFSNSKRMKDFLDVQRDHPELLNKSLRCLKKNGVLYFSNNLQRFQLDKERIHASEIRDITRATTPFDFQGKLKRWCYRITK